MVIVQESLCGFSESGKGRAIVPSENSVLPQGIEAFHRGIPTGFSLRDKDKVDPQKQMEAYDLGKAIGIAASARSGHLVVHLGEPRTPHKGPACDEVSTQRKSSFVRKLGC